MPKGDKDDSNKVPIHLIPTEAILGMAQALGMGAKKYGAYNFRSGIEYTRIIDSLMRHTLAYLAGEENDQESGLPHTYHMLANAAMLEWMRVHHPELDNRYKNPKNIEEDKININDLKGTIMYDPFQHKYIFPFGTSKKDKK
jgi:hypothetical protein